MTNDTISLTDKHDKYTAVYLTNTAIYFGQELDGNTMMRVAETTMPAHRINLFRDMIRWRNWCGGGELVKSRFSFPAEQHFLGDLILD